MDPQLIGGIIALVGIAVAAYVALRYSSTVKAANDATKAAMDAADAWKLERDAEVLRRERSDAQLAKAQQEISVLQGRVDELSRRPDLRELEKSLALHEERAADRGDRLVGAITALVTRIEERG